VSLASAEAATAAQCRRELGKAAVGMPPRYSSEPRAIVNMMLGNKDKSPIAAELLLMVGPLWHDGVTNRGKGRSGI